MQCAQLQQTLPVLIYFPNFMPSQANGPRLVVSANLGVEVAEQQQLFLTGDPLYDGLQLVVELILDFLRGVEDGGVGTNEIDRSVGCVKA